jgi:hypothetical protein
MVCQFSKGHETIPQHSYSSSAAFFKRTPLSFEGSGGILISTGLQPGGSKRHVRQAVLTAFLLPSSGEPDKTGETVFILPDSLHPAEAVC